MSLPKIRVLIVDDSVLVRRLLTDMLSADPEIEVAGTAANGKLGLLNIQLLNPDLVTLDIEMPEMDGLTVLTELRKNYPKLPVIMCSTLTVGGGISTLEALGRGANDYVTKPSNATSRENAFKQLREELIPKIKALARKTRPGDIRIPAGSLPIKSVNLIRSSTTEIEVVAIGTSTGGPNALNEVIPLIPKNFPVPILIVQHMPPLFTRLLAESLTSKSQIPVREACDGDEIIPGGAWIAPGNYHMDIEPRGQRKFIKLTQDSPENSCRPAVDVLFRAVAKNYGPRALAVVMTGMGQDGLRGCECIREASGQIFIQDEATSVVWGMPGFVSRAGLADQILPLHQIGQKIVEKIGEKRTGVTL